tara:strand:+ start:348 stop:536 length:189 start_codon:yes stop_codon:yes gene_type:complete
MGRTIRTDKGGGRQKNKGGKMKEKLSTHTPRKTSQDADYWEDESLWESTRFEKFDDKRKRTR